MSWKSRTKELSPEEALARAKADFASYWFHSDPLIVPIKREGEVQAFPLTEEFRKGSWLIWFLDPTRLDFESALYYVRELNKRYGSLGLTSLLILRAPENASSAWVSAQGTQILSLELSFPCAIDPGGMLSQALGSTSDAPSFLLMSQGAPVFACESLDALSSCDSSVQEFLRKSDPGLPLQRPIEPQKGLVQEVGTIRFKKGHRLPSHIEIKGQWTLDDAKIKTTDPQAEIMINLPGSELGIVAEALQADDVLCRVRIAFPGQPEFEEIRGEGIDFDADGVPYALATLPFLVKLLKQVPDRHRRVSIQFPEADRHPIAVHSIHFGNI